MRHLQTVCLIASHVSRVGLALFLRIYVLSTKLAKINTYYLSIQDLFPFFYMDLLLIIGVKATVPSHRAQESQASAGIIKFALQNLICAEWQVGNSG